MAVYFTRLRIRNFRSCVDTDLELAPYTALIGRNNCGKSNCLTALQWLLRKTSLDAEDFNDPLAGIEVVGYLEGVDEAALESLIPLNRGKIAPFVQDGRLVMRRFQAAPGASADLTFQIPASGDWAPNPSGIDNAIKAIFPEPIRIGAMEDAEEDASKAKTSTTIGKLLGEMLHAIRETHHDDLAPHLAQLTARLSVEGDQRFAALGQIDTSINSKIGDLFPGMAIKLDFPVPEIEALIKGGTVRVYEGAGAGRAFGSYGHGAQRAIQMAMVRHLADLRRGDEIVGGAPLLLVDEPELFMHPFAIEQVREALRALSAAGYQVVFSTHSAQMILPTDAQQAVVMAKTAEAGTIARPKLRSAVEEVEHDATHQLYHLFSLTNSSQVLFADRVVLTEGKTELRLLPTLFQEASGATMGQAATALVALGGVANTAKSMRILAALGIPACAIVDLDFVFRNARSHGLLEDADPDVAACIAVLARLAAAGTIQIDGGGLPRSGGGVSAAKAFELLAAEQDATPHIDALVQKLRGRNIWLWNKGAIEAHLGLSKKGDESAYLQFQLDCTTAGLDATCVDSGAVRELVAWIRGIGQSAA